jgi:membrane-bound lytic murein transglycosylase B
MKILFLLLVAVFLFAKDDVCNFTDKNYEDVCNKAISEGVSYEYANAFLTSEPKTKKLDEVSFELMQPKQIEVHKQNEKKANNTLVKYIPQIVAHLKEYSAVYDHAEGIYNVNREVVASILMKETRLGKITPKHDAFIVFNTLVVKTEPNSPREKWLITMGKSNMVSIIKYCYEKGITPDECNLPSSYAGAIGIPQFMPNNLSFAQGYQKEIPDVTTMEDAILSASNFLNKRAEFNELIKWQDMPDIADIESRWYDFEFENENASFVYATNKAGNKTYNCFSCEYQELDYLREYTKKIMSYNNSSNYAVGVMRLAYEANKLLREELASR